MEDDRSAQVRRALQHAIFCMMTCAYVEALSDDEDIDRSELRQVMTECYLVISQAGMMQPSVVTEKEARRRAKELWIKIRQVVDAGTDAVGDDADANRRDFQTARRSMQIAKEELALALG